MFRGQCLGSPAGARWFSSQPGLANARSGCVGSVPTKSKSTQKPKKHEFRENES